jgi:hypothetical protein
LDSNVRKEIINFVINSSEEENKKVATFIAGMQAQKRIERRVSGKTKNTSSSPKGMLRPQAK